MVVLGLGVSKGCVAHTVCRISQGMKLCFLWNFQEWSENQENSRGFVKKVCPQPPSLDFFLGNILFKFWDIDTWRWKKASSQESFVHYLFTSSSSQFQMIVLSLEETSFKTWYKNQSSCKISLIEAVWKLHRPIIKKSQNNLFYVILLLALAKCYWSLLKRLLN